MDVDHIIPRSHSGSNDPENLQVLCANCNRSKGNKDNTDFRRVGLQDHDLVRVNKMIMQKDDTKITGFNVGVNVGADAGQTISHVHIHLIPRRKGDSDDPRGGVRGVIASRMNYKIK